MTAPGVRLCLGRVVKRGVDVWMVRALLGTMYDGARSRYSAWTPPRPHSLQPPTAMTASRLVGALGPAPLQAPKNASRACAPPQLQHPSRRAGHARRRPLLPIARKHCAICPDEAAYHSMAGRYRALPRSRRLYYWRVVHRQYFALIFSRPCRTFADPLLER